MRERDEIGALSEKRNDTENQRGKKLHWWGGRCQSVSTRQRWKVALPYQIDNAPRKLVQNISRAGRRKHRLLIGLKYRSEGKL